MQRVHSFVFTLFFMMSMAWPAGAQSSVASFLDALTPPNYSDCAAILYQGEILVDEYSPEGKCKLEQGMKGALTVATVKLSSGGGTPVKNIPFRVAIKNARTNTLWMYSEQALLEVQLEDILKKCEPGDRILFLTTGQRYSLPHNEIDLNWGC